VLPLWGKRLWGKLLCSFWTASRQLVGSIFVSGSLEPDGAGMALL
jgi:hypothetical protein